MGGAKRRALAGRELTGLGAGRVFIGTLGGWQRQGLCASVGHAFGIAAAHYGGPRWARRAGHTHASEQSLVVDHYVHRIVVGVRQQVGGVVGVGVGRRRA